MGCGTGFSQSDSETAEMAHPGSSRHTSWHLFLCIRVQAQIKFLNASNSAEDQKDAQVLLDCGPQQSQVLEPRFPRPQSCAVVYLPQTQHGALQTLRVMQVSSGPCWGHRAVLPPVSIPAQAGAVPVSSEFWLHWEAQLCGREQSGEHS